MTPDQIAEVRPRLLEFTNQMLGGLPRTDQQAKGELYTRGLLLDGRRKSMRPTREDTGFFLTFLAFVPDLLPSA